MRRRKTDYGTIILHWLLVSAIVVAFVTGLRIATEAPDRAWLNSIDFLLPRANVWVPHMEAAVVLVVVTIAYVIYITRSGLSPRVTVDKVRLRGLFGRKAARLGSLSVLLTWSFFVAMILLIGTGGLLFFGLDASDDVMLVHWYATWAVAAFAGSHVLTHLSIGGSSQLLRIFRPQPLPPPPPRLDAVELLTMLVEREQSAQATSETTVEPHYATKAPLQPVPPLEDAPYLRQQETRRSPERQEIRRPPPERQEPRRAPAVPQPQFGSGPRRPAKKRRNMTLQSNPFVVAAAIAITGASAIVAADWFVSDTLVVHRIASADAPIVDGDTSDPVWRNIKPFSVTTNQGANLDGKGESRIDIRAVHDDTWAYFLFTWEDPTRSLKQLPLIKQADGWHVLHNGYERGDENDYNEDKFAVLLTTLTVDLAGDRTFHASPKPLPDEPATMTGRGLHYTMAQGVYADVWQWKATSSGTTGWMDDDHFGPPAEPTPEQVRNVVPYRGGFAPDPGTANYSDNFVWSPDAAVGNAGNQVVTPRRLPKDLAATVAAMGQINLDPNVGESDGARWFMTDAESQPYSPEQDKTIPVGTVIPGVLISGEYSGDRADIRCAARWASGHWALEVVRRLDTHSQYDIPIKTGAFMRVSVFDHTQIRHTRHVRPIRVEVE